METKNENSQEIDLSYLSKKTISFFDKLGYTIFRFFRFVLTNIVIIAGILILGAVAGYFLDQQNPDNYKHEIIVVPNFNSTSYLYNQIENLETQDSPIKSIEVEPILDVYQFITERYGNLEVAKYLSENNIQFNKYQPKSDVEKMYRYHLLTIYTDQFDKNGIIVSNFLKGLNNDEYYLQRQKIEVANTQKSIKELNSSVESINKILDKLGNNDVKSGELNIEMYSELNNLINSKKSLIDEIGRANVYLLEQSKIVYDSSTILNIKDKKFPMLILLPVVLLLVYFFVIAFIQSYKKYSQKQSIS